MRPDMKEVVQGANLVDCDLLARFLLAARIDAIPVLIGQCIRLQQAEIRVIALH